MTITGEARALEERASWLRERKKYLGGSDMAGALGLVDADTKKPFFGKTPLSVYADKTNDSVEDSITDPDVLARMANGTDLEDGVSRIYERITGNRVRRYRRIVKSKRYPWLAANPDRLVASTSPGIVGKTLVEIKTTGSHDWMPKDETDLGGIPAPYMAQIQHYLLVTGAVSCDLIVFYHIGDVRVFRDIRPHKEVQQLIIDVTGKLWNDHIVPRIPPPPMAIECAAIFREDQGTSIQLDPDDNETLVEVMRGVELQVAAKAIKIELDSIKLGLQARLEDNRWLLSSDGTKLVDWNTVRPNTRRINLKVIEKDDPDMFEMLMDKYGEIAPPHRSFSFKIKKEQE